MITNILKTMKFDSIRVISSKGFTIVHQRAEIVNPGVSKFSIQYNPLVNNLEL